MNIYMISKSKPFQMFRHRIYIPICILIGFFNDFKRGVRTQKIIELSDLGVDPNIGARYETISYSNLKQSLKYAFETGFDQFLDIGCGLGRSLIVANEVGFSRILGVDISWKLLDLCKTNLNKQGFAAELTCKDDDDLALTVGILVVYLFNPFGEDKMAKLLSRIGSRSSETLIIYHNPKYTSIFKDRYLIKEIVWHHFGYMKNSVTFILSQKGRRQIETF